MNTFIGYLIAIGLMNRDGELQLPWIVLAIASYRYLVTPVDVVLLGILLLALVAYFANSWIEYQKKRGLWERMASLEGRYEHLKKDHENTKLVVTNLNNKQVLSQFQQGISRKQ